MFFIQVMPKLVFSSTLVSVLYHLGVMQAIITVTAGVMRRAMGTTAAESVHAAAAIFVGPVCITPVLSFCHILLLSSYFCSSRCISS